MDEQEAELRHWESQVASETAGRTEMAEAQRAILDGAAQEVARLREAFGRGERLDFKPVRQAFAQLDDESGHGQLPVD